MSPRPKKERIMEQPPSIKGFIPADVLSDEAGSVMLSLEEYESIRLSDYLHMTQLEASRMLNISRPTFTRIYQSARRKVAEAMVENRPLQIRGGSVTFQDAWYSCGRCETVFRQKKGAGNKKLLCPVCHSPEVKGYDEHAGKVQPRFNAGKGAGSVLGQNGSCICPRCDHRVAHQPGVPCSGQLCPHCDIRMVRENSPYHLKLKKIRRPI